MAITRSQITDALDANLNEMFQDGLTDWGEEYSKFLNVYNSDKQSEKDSYSSGFVTMPEKTEGASAIYDPILPGISKTYTHKTYAFKKLDAPVSNYGTNQETISVEALVG